MVYCSHVLGGLSRESEIASVDPSNKLTSNQRPNNAFNPFKKFAFLYQSWLFLFLKSRSQITASKRTHLSSHFGISLSLSFKILFICKRWRERERASEHTSRVEGHREKEEQTPPWAGSLTQGSIPASWDDGLSRRQKLNPGTPFYLESLITLDNCLLILS